jgi:putative thioredoxin
MVRDVRDFQKEVIQKSYEVPVVVDFWAEWCAPCRVLGPILERLSQQDDKKWLLAKLNTEEFPAIAQEYGIHSIPNVKLFVDGKVAAEFVGALPEPHVRRWLEEVVPSQFRKQIEQAGELLRRGERVRAEQLLEEVLQREPENSQARILHSQALLFKDPQRAAQVVENFDDPKYNDFAEAVRTVARLDALSLNPDSLPEADVRETYREGIRALFVQDFDTALERFIDVIRRDRYYDDDGARKACIAIFKILGEDHPTTEKHRREFSSALYV